LKIKDFNCQRNAHYQAKDQTEWLRWYKTALSHLKVGMCQGSARCTETTGMYVETGYRRLHGPSGAMPCCPTDAILSMSPTAGICAAKRARNKIRVELVRWLARSRVYLRGLRFLKLHLGDLSSAMSQPKRGRVTIELIKAALLTLSKYPHRHAKGKKTSSQ
jgi:hypothetical protein